MSDEKERKKKRKRRKSKLVQTMNKGELVRKQWFLCVKWKSEKTEWRIVLIYSSRKNLIERKCVTTINYSKLIMIVKRIEFERGESEKTIDINAKNLAWFILFRRLNSFAVYSIFGFLFWNAECAKYVATINDTM